MLKPEAHKVEIPCPDCGHASPHMLGKLVDADSVACRFCRATIDVSDEDRQAAFRKMLDGLRQLYTVKP